MPNKINVMISTDPKGHGGVASVVNAMLSQKFSADWNIRHIISHRTGSKFTVLLSFLKSYLQLIFIRLRVNPGIAHIHLASRGSFTRKYLLAKLAVILGFEVIIHLHGGQFDNFYEYECNNKQKLKVIRLFNSARTIIVLSTQWKSWVCQNFPFANDVRIIYNFVSITALNRNPSIAPTILYLGRLNHKKGVLDLLNALPSVVSKVPDVKLILAGDGDICNYKNYASLLGISKHVEFTGWIDEDKKISLLSKVSALTLPSYSEGFPVVIIEAMAFGLPVVASTVGGIPDAITHGKDGLLFKAGDIVSLSDSLIEVLTNQVLANRLGSCAKQKYVNCFSCAAVMPHWYSLYTDILNG